MKLDLESLEQGNVFKIADYRTGWEYSDEEILYIEGYLDGKGLKHEMIDLFDDNGVIMTVIVL